MNRPSGERGNLSKDDLSVIPLSGEIGEVAKKTNDRSDGFKTTLPRLFYSQDYDGYATAKRGWVTPARSSTKGNLVRH